MGCVVSFFFFKQKTAYEMRISDWSSDVCSSDLQLALQQELTDLPKFRRFGGETAFIEGWGLYAESLGKSLGVYETPYDYFGYLQNEIGRASCRERVCQYV